VFQRHPVAAFSISSNNTSSFGTPGSRFIPRVALPLPANPPRSTHGLDHLWTPEGDIWNVATTDNSTFGHSYLIHTKTVTWVISLE
jgi:hypothetical protein